MQPGNFLGNLIWLLFGGLFAAAGYFIGGLVLCFTIIGIPFGLQCFKLAGIVLWPFGVQIRNHHFNTGCLTIIANVIWLLCGGIWTAIWHIVFGIIFSLTIIGIPFGRMHFKLVEVSMMPFGKQVSRP